MEKEYTNRGFVLYKFIDRYGTECSLQSSSLATESCIWLGVDNANPQIMVYDAVKLELPYVGDCGWTPYAIPKEVLLTTRMHLNQQQVKELLPHLIRFAETGEL